MRLRPGLLRPWPGSLAWRSHAHRASFHYPRDPSARCSRIGSGRRCNTRGSRERAHCPRALDGPLHGHQHVPPCLNEQTQELTAPRIHSVRGAAVGRGITALLNCCVIAWSVHAWCSPDSGWPRSAVHHGPPCVPTARPERLRGPPTGRHGRGSRPEATASQPTAWPGKSRGGRGRPETDPGKLKRRIVPIVTTAVLGPVCREPRIGYA
jgi:hypothetical protein